MKPNKPTDIHDITTLNEERLRELILDALAEIAPEGDLATLQGTSDIREALDIDSMDFLKLVVALHDKAAVDVPEKDYAKIRTLDGCMDYVAKALATRA